MMANDKKANKPLKKSKKKRFHPKEPKDTIDEDISSLQARYSEIDSNEINTFKDFPLSASTLKGLKENSYTVPTKIQKETIGLALQKFDILGAAKTGSGKTLAFLIPLLESLYCYKWTKLDSLGALIITPTRELALQIFETLRRIGRYHDFSAGLVIGGKDLKFERSRMDAVNIIVCTPGRLLQHMDENPLFNCDNMKILILDEADRCLDMGFESTMNAIIENLPLDRQTFLFSATQTKSVKDLARLSLKDPKYVSVHEHDKHKTPEGLVQSYIVCEQHEKITVLWSFISSHLQNKILVFFSTCNQVRYTHEVFKQLHPRTTLLALHGKMHQLKRMEVYKTFCSKKHAVLFATDIAARGLDFPEVHWVVQLDCPEDVETYIHRAGRTARYHKGGECLLVLRPSELPIVANMTSAKIPINQIKVNPAKMFSPQGKIEALMAKKVSYKEMAQRAFVSYVKSVFLMKDKSVFDVKSIDLAQFSRSLGLVVCPRVRFLKKHIKSNETDESLIIDKMKLLNDKNKVKNDNEEEGSGSESSCGDNYVENTAKELDFDNKEGHKFDFDVDDDEDDILTIKRKNHDLPANFSALGDLAIGDLENISKKQAKKLKPIALAKKILRKKIVVNKKIIFTEEGEAIAHKMRERVTDIGRDYELNNEEGGINIQQAKTMMKEEDQYDKVLFREKIKAKKRELKRKRKEQLGLLKKRPEDEEDVEDESEHDSDSSGPDLSWLPDPDKIYGKLVSGKSSDNDDVNSEEEEEALPKKAKLLYNENSESDDNISLRDEEEFALHLLSKDT